MNLVILLTKSRRHIFSEFSVSNMDVFSQVSTL